MPIDMFGLVIGKVQAENRGLQPPESTKIGLISAFMANPVMSLVISRSLADKAVESLPPPPPAPPDGGAGETGGPHGGQPQTDFERSVAESLERIEGDVARLNRDVANLKSQQPPPQPAPGGQAAPYQAAPAKETSGKPGKGGGTP